MNNPYFHVGFEKSSLAFRNPRLTTYSTGLALLVPLIINKQLLAG
jgi:hypothetical protein